MRGKENLRALIPDKPVSSVIIGSFQRFLLENYRSEYIEYITRLLESGRMKLGKRSETVPAPDAVRVERIGIERIDLFQKSLDEVYADIIVSVAVTVSQNRSGIILSDHLRQWYRVRTYSVLAPFSRSFNNLDCIMIYDRYQSPPGMALDEYLVPYIRNETLDDAGEDVLRIFFPEALDTPCRVDGEQLAAKMRLSVRYYRLTLDCDIRGQMYYEKRAINVLGKNGRARRVTIPANTILVDLYSCTNEDGSISKEKLNDTVIHECFHAYKHRLFYLGQRLYSEKLRCLSCSADGERTEVQIEEGFDLSYNRNADDALLDDSSPHERSPIEWIEWQANRVTPRIRMPEKPARAMIETLMERYHSRAPGAQETTVIERVINELASFFGVSKQSAKNRMIELGYPEARGVLNFVNGAYIENFSFSPGSLQKNQTFSIGLQDALELFQKDASFRRCMDSGNYQYIDGHFCRASPQFVFWRGEELHLTQYARSHMDECCLVFSVRYHAAGYRYQKGTLLREAVEPRKTVEFSGQDYLLPDLMEESTRLFSIINNLPMSPAKTLAAHMDREHITVEGLVAKSGVSSRTISRLRDEENLYTPKKEAAIAICIGLHLEPLLSRDWLTKVGTPLTTSKKDVFYELILRSMYMQPVSAVNSQLGEYGLPPLSKCQDELDE